MYADTLQQRDTGITRISLSAKAIVILPILSTLAVLLRIYVRKASKIPLRWDDWTIIAAIPFAWASWAGYLYIADNILGGTLQDTLRPEQVTPLMRAIYATNLIYIIGVFIVKLSIILFFYRAFGTDPFRRRAIHAVFFINVVTSGVRFSSNFTGCIPANKFWLDPAHCQRHGFSQHAFSLASESISSFGEILLLILPLPFVWQLRAPVWRKIGICAVFCLGGAAAGTGLVRVFLIARYWRNIQDLTLKITIPVLEICNVVETSCGTVAICIMAIWGPLQKMIAAGFKRVRGVRDSSATSPTIGDAFSRPTPKKSLFQITTIDVTVDQEQESKEETDLERQSG